MLAARWRGLDAMQCLLAAGADPNLEGAGKHAGFTALRAANDMVHAQGCFADLGSAAPVVRMLLTAGADPDAYAQVRCQKAQEGRALPALPAASGTACGLLG